LSTLSNKCLTEDTVKYVPQVGTFHEYKLDCYWKSTRFSGSINMSEFDDNDQQSESVNKYQIIALHLSAMCNRANSGVNRTKFISLATVPYILSFIIG